MLRIGHRAGRDPRLTTHLALTARAFGAERMYLHPPDPELSARVAAVTRGWGGDFEVVGVRDWKAVVRDFPGTVLHLSMYGLPLESNVARITSASEVLLAVGGAKVPADLYRRADLNIAIGHQPHSEVAAVAVILARLRGIPGPEAWPGAERVIVPQARGKKVVGTAAK